MHLFVVLLGPTLLESYGPSPQLLMASVCSIRADLPHDTACLIREGEHAFVGHASYVSYRHMCVEATSHVQQMVDGAIWPEQPAFSAELLQRAGDGVCASKLTPRFLKVLFGCPRSVR
jgi:hypothetical protein